MLVNCLHSYEKTEKAGCCMRIPQMYWWFSSRTILSASG